MQRVANHRFLFRRGQVYYFKRAIPKDVRQAFGGKAVDVVSLQTTSLSEARHALGVRLSEFERLVAKARMKPDPMRHATSILPLSHRPTHDEIDEAVRAWLFERMRDVLPKELRRHEHEDIVQEQEQAREGTLRAMRSRRSPPQLNTTWIAEHLAAKHGWIVSEDDTYLVRAVARAELAWADTVKAEVVFEDRPTPTGFLAPELYRKDVERDQRFPQHRPISIMSLFEAYAAEAKPSPATLKAWRTCLRSLIDHLGHDDASKVAKSDVVAWKDALLVPEDGDPGRSHTTISKKYLAAAKTVFGWAERNDKIATNPAATVAIMIPRKRRLRSEPGLTEKEARIILTAACKAEPDTAPLRGFGRRWIPWLCAYTGARVGEIAQLRTEDVFKHEAGIWCIRITPEAGEQKANRAREVPLHPHIIEQGFLAVIEGRTGPLFYDPGKHRGGSASNPQHKKVAERLARWVRELGVTDKELLPNHGWRHRFKRVARSVRMDHEARDNIQGHAARTEGDKYGGTDIQFRYEEICKLPWYQVGGEA